MRCLEKYGKRHKFCAGKVWKTSVTLLCEPCFNDLSHSGTLHMTVVLLLASDYLCRQLAMHSETHEMWFCLRWDVWHVNFHQLVIYVLIRLPMHWWHCICFSYYLSIIWLCTMLSHDCVCTVTVYSFIHVWLKLHATVVFLITMCKLFGVTVFITKWAC